VSHCNDYEDLNIFSPTLLPIDHGLEITHPALPSDLDNISIMARLHDNISSSLSVIIIKNNNNFCPLLLGEIHRFTLTNPCAIMTIDL
jgi:hypothetical protein